MNNRSRPLTLALEPLGYFFDIAPDQSQIADFAPNGPDQPRLDVWLDEDGVAVWEESGDARGLRPEGGQSGAEGPA